MNFSAYIKCRLQDEYLHFYFTFIKPNIVRIQGGQLAFNLVNPRLLQQWHGYAYERFCLKHSHEIARHLQFAGIKFAAGSWFKNDGKSGAQIDLVFDRADKVLTICEIKHVDKLSVGTLIDGFEKKVMAIKEQYPAYATQKVLILAKKINVPASVSRHFSHVMFTNDFAMN